MTHGRRLTTHKFKIDCECVVHIGGMSAEDNDNGELVKNGGEDGDKYADADDDDADFGYDGDDDDDPMPS